MPTFSIPWNTAASANSAHTIHAVVTDLSGNQVTTSTITVTSSNVAPDPGDPPPVITPPPPPVTVPVVVSTTPIPLGAVFYNTLGEFSTFIAQTVFPSSTDPDISGAFTEDWINVVRDFGVTGVGNETDKMQAALDAARDAVTAGGKTKVLIPGGTTVSVGPIEDDLSDGSFFGAMGVCLWLDSGVTLRIDGTLKAHYDYTYSYANDVVTVFENRNAFVGDSTDIDEEIVIEGNGTIDLEGIYSSGELVEDGSFSASKQIKHILALRAYKTSKLTIKDVTIKHGVGEKFQTGFCEHVDFRNIKFDTSLIYDDPSAPVDTALINLDVCHGVHVFGCYTKDCKVYRGVANWASKEVTIDGNNFSDISGVNDDDLIGTPIWFVDYGMEFGSSNMDNTATIYELNEGLDARLLITNNTFCRNGANGIQIFGGALQGALTNGVNIHNNIICSNAINGILIDGLKDFEISGNQLNNMGWGMPLIFD